MRSIIDRIEYWAGARKMRKEAANDRYAAAFETGKELIYKIWDIDTEKEIEKELLLILAKKDALALLPEDYYSRPFWVRVGILNSIDLKNRIRVESARRSI